MLKSVIVVAVAAGYIERHHGLCVLTRIGRNRFLTCECVFTSDQSTEKK